MNTSKHFSSNAFRGFFRIVALAQLALVFSGCTIRVIDPAQIAAFFSEDYYSQMEMKLSIPADTLKGEKGHTHELQPR